jgi:CubicO group peptidase (beta-lactamase class C family)
MKLLRRLLPFVVILVAALLLVYLPDMAPERYGDLESFFSGEMQRQGLIGMTAASVRYGKPDMAIALGTDARGIPLEPFTPMAIGQLGEAITGTLARIAEREKYLDPSKPLAFYVPELELRKDKSGAAGSPSTPTVRDFLTHSSGYQYLDSTDKHGAPPNLAGVASRLTADLDFNSPAGSASQAGGRLGLGHSLGRGFDAGYDAIGLALERSMKLPFAELVTKRIFKPLKMAQSDAQGGGEAKRIPQGSTSFFWTAIPRDQELPTSHGPSTSMISTAPDFARFMAALTAPGFGGTEAFGPDITERISTPLVKGSPWTYGWKLRDTKQGRELHIDASIAGFTAVAAIWPDRQAGIVMMVPEGSVLLSWLIMPLMVDGARRILLDESTEPPIPWGRCAILLAVIASIHAIVLTMGTGRALTWARALRGRSDASGSSAPLRFARLRCMTGIAIRLGIIIAVPPAISAFAGSGFNWALLLDREPGLALWAIAALGIGILRCVTRLSWLRKPPAKVGKMLSLLKESTWT